MRFTLKFIVNGDLLPIDYRPIFISFLKNALSNYKKGTFYNKYYKDITEKPFTIATNLGPCTYQNGTILLASNQIRLYFSTSDIETGIHFYNAFIRMKGDSLPLPYSNSMVLTNVNIEKEVNITSNSILCSFIAPLCIRQHNKESNKDTYITYEDAAFESELKIILNNQINRIKDFNSQMISDLIIRPNVCKKVFIRFYEHFMPCTIGTFIIKGDIQLLTYLYQSGVASRKSSGFGYFNIITQGGDDIWAEQ